MSSGGGPAGAVGGGASKPVSRTSVHGVAFPQDASPAKAGGASAVGWTGFEQGGSDPLAHGSVVQSLRRNSSVVNCSARTISATHIPVSAFTVYRYQLIRRGTYQRC